MSAEHADEAPEQEPTLDDFTEPQDGADAPESDGPAPGTVKHGPYVDMLRAKAGELSQQSLSLLVAADLLEMHDATSVSLDSWETARAFVERLVGGPVYPNGA